MDILVTERTERVFLPMETAFEPPCKLSPDDIRKLATDVTAVMRKRLKVKNFADCQIFELVLGKSAATLHTLFMYLHDVTTCPPEVIAWCEEQLLHPEQ